MSTATRSNPLAVLLRDAVRQAVRSEKLAAVAVMPDNRTRLYRLQRNALFIFAKNFTSHRPDEDAINTLIEELRDAAESLIAAANDLERMWGNEEDLNDLWERLDDLMGNDYVTDGVNCFTEDSNRQFDTHEANEEILIGLRQFDVHDD